MAKINDTTTYPNTAPALTDHVAGTDVSNTTNDANGETVTFTMQAIMDLIEANGQFTESNITDLGTYQVQLAEGAFVDGDKTKLDGIEASADVTDAANVETAIEGITLSSVAGATGDEVLIVDATDGGLKAVLWENLPGAGGGISNVVEDTTPQLGGQLDVNGNGLGDGTLELLTFTETASAVNHVNITNAATTGAPVVASTGDDTNVDLALATKGSGIVELQAGMNPNADGTISLGTTSLRYSNLSVDSIDLAGVTLDGTTLADPGADRILFWDDSAGTTAYLTASTGLSISTTNLAVDTSVVTTLTGTQTLTNKTLTAPTITSITASHDYNAQTGTTYTLVAGDQSAVVSMSNASANTLTIPTNASVAFPTGTIVTIFALGAGTTTIAGATGVTLSGAGGSASAGSCDIQTQYGSATIIKIGTDSWLVAGDIDAVA